MRLEAEARATKAERIAKEEMERRQALEDELENLRAQIANCS